MHTRNPFLRHSDDHRSPAPSAPSAPLTPAAVPLPLPTPDELVDNVLFGIMGMDWRLRVCWLLVLRQVFVELMCFWGDGLRISHRMEVLRGYEWKMKMLWMLNLWEIRSRITLHSILFV